MRSPHRGCLVVLSLLMASWAVADPGWAEYRDPQGTYTLSRPNGWVVKPMPQANTILVGPSDLCYLAMGAEANVRGLNAVQLAQQLFAGVPVQAQSGGVRQVSARPDVACVDYVFRAPNGQAVQGKIMASVDASMCYAIFYVAPQAQFEQALPVFCQIAASFRHAQVTLPPALYGGQQAAAPAPRPAPAPQPAPVPAPVPTPLPSGDERETQGPTVHVPSEWSVTWKSKGTFQAGDRQKGATEGAMVCAIEVEGSYAAPSVTLAEVLTKMHGYRNVEVKAIAGDEKTVENLRRTVRDLSKVEIEAVVAKFSTPDGVECLGVGYTVNVVFTGARDKYSCYFALYFASKDRFDALVPSFRETAKSIVAWENANDLSEELGQGSLMVLDAMGGSQATPDRASAPRPEPRPGRQGGGLVEKLGPSVRSR